MLKRNSIVHVYANITATCSLQTRLLLPCSMVNWITNFCHIFFAFVLRATG